MRRLVLIVAAATTLAAYTVAPDASAAPMGSQAAVQRSAEGLAGIEQARYRPRHDRYVSQHRHWRRHSHYRHHRHHWRYAHYRHHKHWRRHVVYVYGYPQVYDEPYYEDYGYAPAFGYGYGWRWRHHRRGVIAHGGFPHRALANIPVAPRLQATTYPHVNAYPHVSAYPHVTGSPMSAPRIGAAPIASPHISSAPAAVPHIGAMPGAGVGGVAHGAAVGGGPHGGPGRRF